jgi:tetratricopeptide (TPR) repeat protein
MVVSHVQYSEREARGSGTMPLRFQSSRTLFTNLLALVCEFALVATSALAATSGTPTSVIVISIDTLRADHLSCYGYRAINTPNIDSLAQGGTLFSQVSSQVPLTLPSHVSLLTSTYPFVNGVEDNGEQLGPNTVTLATVLKSRGYRTAAFVGGYVLDRRFGLGQGFDVYDSPFDVNRARVADPGDIKRMGEEVVRTATEWLNKNDSAPFFVFLHLYDLHTPYSLPARIRARLGGSGYDAELAYVDEVLGNFFKFLDQQGLRKNVLLVFTSDHGEGLGEHAEGAHGYFIYQSTLRVPLIIHWPSGAGPFPAHVSEPTSLLNVAPTILQFLGVPQPAQFQGRSILGSLRGESPRGSEEIYSESLYGRRHFGVAALRSLRLGRYKYIETPKFEFYDLQGDPGETRNLYANQTALASSFRVRLVSLRSRFRVGSSSPQVVSPEVLARLQSLGYVAVSSAHSEAAESGPDPKDRIAAFERYGYALRLATKGRLRESRAVLEQLLAQDPGLIDVRISLGLTQQELGQHQEAVEEFREVLKQDPLNVVAHFNLGVSYSVLGRSEDAIKEFQATLAIAPYYSRADELLANVFLEKQEYQLARSHFEHLLTFAPDDFTAHYSLGALAIREDRWDDALLHLRAALKADPQSAEAHNTLGSLYFLRGDLEGARREFAEAIRQMPNFAQAHYNLGLVFQKQKENDKAAEQFRLALQADPELRAAREALNSLGDHQ